MLTPSMQELMKKVNNRYLLVNLAAQRARDLSNEAEEKQEKLPEKPVKMALDEIATGKIEYRPGPKPEKEIKTDILESITMEMDAELTVTPEEEITASAEDIVEDL